MARVVHPRAKLLAPGINATRRRSHIAECGAAFRPWWRFHPDPSARV